MVRAAADCLVVAAVAGLPAFQLSLPSSLAVVLWPLRADSKLVAAV